MKKLKPLVVYTPAIAAGLFIIFQNLFITMLPGCGGFGMRADALACAFINVWLWGLCGVIGSAAGIYLSKKMQNKLSVKVYTGLLVLSAIPLIYTTLLFTAGFIEKKGYDKQDAVWQKMFDPFKEAAKGQAKHFREHRFFADSFQKLGVEFPGMSIVPCPEASTAQECLEGRGLIISLETLNDNRAYRMTFANKKEKFDVEHFIVQSVSRHNSQDILIACDAMTQRGIKMCKAFGGQQLSYSEKLKYGKMDYKINM